MYINDFNTQSPDNIFFSSWKKYTHTTNNTRVWSAWSRGKRFLNMIKFIPSGACELMWCFKNANFSAFNEIHSLFLDDFSESKLLIKGFFSLQKKKKNCIRIQGLPIVLRRPLLPNFPRGSSKTQSTIKITYSCTAGGCGGNKIKFSWSMAAVARYILLANDILTVCMVNPNFFEGT